MFLVVDKPKGLTSHDVVNEIRKITGERRVGHGGALDPNATGILIVAVGREFTKQLHTILKDKDKTYIAEIVLGEERDTQDVEGKVTKRYKINVEPDITKVSKVLESFKGKRMQTPPAFSAVKVGGKSAYKIARLGGTVNLSPKEVFIKQIHLLSYSFPVLTIEVQVSAGTYVRTLAQDIGKTLETGAYVANLKRTGVGNITLTQAISLNEITAQNWKTKAVKVV